MLMVMTQHIRPEFYEAICYPAVMVSLFVVILLPACYSFRICFNCLLCHLFPSISLICYL